MLSYKEYLEIAERGVQALSLPAEPARLYDPIRYTMQPGGKRLRPVLALMSCEAVGGRCADALPVAVGLEMFHNFTLLHDDVMDRAEVRRGLPTVHRRWDDNVAILSGDAMLTLATMQVAEAPWACHDRVMALYNRTAMEIYEGQQCDMDFESRTDVSVREYMEMIRLKTSVLLGCACKAGALCGAADEATAQGLYDMAVDLGLAFQLRDDYLDVWGDPATFGKAIGGDIECGKKTFLLINAVERDASVLEMIASDRADKVAAVTATYERLGLDRLALEAIARFSDCAHRRLLDLHLPADATAAFEALIVSMTARKQ